jgi:DNA adenine methylase
VRNASPLRYPGGKWRFTTFFNEFIAQNFGAPPLYIEPYAGGAGLALSLLFDKKVSGIWLNDLDPAIHACWHSIIYDSERFCETLESVPITLEEWRIQKGIYAKGLESGTFALGFATFFLNRTNHSGILNGGAIGGKEQRGTWKLDARFNRTELMKRVQRIAEHRKDIKLTCLDAEVLIKSLGRASKCLVYLDPPYVAAGKALYMNAYGESDHASVRKAVGGLRRKWIVSYDDVPLVRKLYRPYRVRSMELLHTAREAKVGSEVLFFSGDCVIPRAARVGTFAIDRRA